MGHKENESEIQSSTQLSVQLKELQGQGKIAQLRLDSVKVKFSEAFEELGRDKKMFNDFIAELFRSATYTERITSNTLWILSLAEQGLSNEQILKVWIGKNKKESDLKDKQQNNSTL